MKSLLVLILSLIPMLAQAATMADVLAGAPGKDWRALDPANTIYVELPKGRVVIELDPKFAPHHVANIKALIAEKYFDGHSITRSQDNYVVQWGNPREPKNVGAAQPTLKAEFTIALKEAAPFTPLGDRDVYAPEAGFVDSRPVARDPKIGKAWLAHCYAMVGAGRDNSPDSGSGAELYVVSGHGPRHLDRNVTLVGRVMKGMELISTVERGTGPLGAIEDPSKFVPIHAVRLAADVPEAERSDLQVLRSDSESFKKLIASRRHREEPWFAYSADHIDLCNVPIPVRESPAH